MRISASWFGSTILLGPPHGRTWQRSATGSGLRLVSWFSSLCKFPRDHCPWLVPAGQKGGRDRPPVLARLIMPLRSRYRAVRIAQLSVAAGRENPPRTFMALDIMTRHALSPSTPRTGAPLRASGVDRSARPSRGGYRAKNAKKPLFDGLRAYRVPYKPSSW